VLTNWNLLDKEAKTRRNDNELYAIKNTSSAIDGARRWIFGGRGAAGRRRASKYIVSYYQRQQHTNVQRSKHFWIRGAMQVIKKTVPQALCKIEDKQCYIWVASLCNDSFAWPVGAVRLCVRLSVDRPSSLSHSCSCRVETALSVVYQSYAIRRVVQCVSCCATYAHSESLTPPTSYRAGAVF